MKNQYVAIYRYLGWSNARWQHTLPTDYPTAKAQVDDINKSGYLARLMSYDDVMAMGLPIGFCKHADALTGKMAEKTCNCT